jgi:hypothetical protein
MFSNFCILDTFQMLKTFNPLTSHTLLFKTPHLLHTDITIVMVFYISLQKLLLVCLPLIFVYVKFVV